MNLTTEFGRIDRAAIVEFAKDLRSHGVPWSEAMRIAHREAAAELRARFNPHRHIQIKRPDEAA